MTFWERLNHRDSKGSVSYLQGLRERGWDEQEVEQSPYMSNCTRAASSPVSNIPHDAKHVKGERRYIETDSCPNIFYKPNVYNAAAGICWVSSRCCGPC